MCISRNFYTAHIAPPPSSTPNGIATSRFSTSKNGTHHCWLEAKRRRGGEGEIMPCLPLAAAGIPCRLPAVAYACVRATSPTLWCPQPTTTHPGRGRLADWLCPHLCKSALPSFLIFYRIYARIHNSRRVRAMTAFAWWPRGLGPPRSLPAISGGSRPRILLILAPRADHKVFHTQIAHVSSMEWNKWREAELSSSRLDLVPT